MMPAHLHQGNYSQNQRKSCIQNYVSELKVLIRQNSSFQSINEEYTIGLLILLCGWTLIYENASHCIMLDVKSESAK